MTPQEEYIVNVLRELKPFERIEIVKDQLGRTNHFLIIRSQKIVVGGEEIKPIK